MATTTNLSTLKINYLTEEQYQSALNGGTLVENEIYMTPSEESGGNSSITLADLGITATAAELNKLDGVTASTAQFNYLKNVTSDIQSQINGKVDSLSDLGITATATELNYCDGVSSNIQTQLNGKMSSSNPTMTGYLSLNRKADSTVGSYSATLGSSCTASGKYSLAGGSNSQATGMYSLAFGNYSAASGEGSIALGMQANSSGFGAVALGVSCAASEQGSIALGNGVLASSAGQLAQGKYNVEDAANTYAHIVGAGTSSSSRKNIYTLDWNGNAWFLGNIKVGSSQKTVATTDDIAAKLDKAAFSLSGTTLTITTT